MAESTWFMYVLSCSDGTLYTGITTDVERRVLEHNGSKLGARYTRARQPVSLMASWPHPDRSAASKAEYAFKRLTRRQKIARIKAHTAQSLA